jgi:hypothetical protein
MTWGAVSSDQWAGDARLATADAKATFLSEARAASLLWVELEPPRPAVRGRLCLYIEGAIERALDARGAPPPARPSAADRDEVATDQIYRAVVSGAEGIAVWLSSLEGIAGQDRTLDTGDSATIRWWLRAANERPVRIGFDTANLELGVYLEPPTLESLLAAAACDERELESDDEACDEGELIAVCNEAQSLDAAQGEEDAPDDAAPSSEVVAAEQPVAVGDTVAMSLRGTPADGLAERARAMADELADDSDTGWLRHALIELSTPEPVAARPPEPVAIAVQPEPIAVQPEPEPVAAHPDPAPVAVQPEPEPVAAHPEPPPPVAVQPLRHIVIEAPKAPREAPVAAKPVGLAEDGAEIAPLPAAVAEPERNTEPPEEPAVPRLELRLAEEQEPAAPMPVAADAEAKRKLEKYWRELSSATGPKPLAVVERLFASAYMPLRTALDRGTDMPALRETADDWSQSFEKSYRDGFDALRVRNKRPAMVVDVPDIALRVARLHGARATQLLLVDSMRFDIGEMVNDRIRALVGQRAACAERFLLWAALPTTTTTQVELIGRGPAGLREPIVPTGEELLVGRGRKAQMVRRLKTGHRELLKLDIVAARLAEPGPGSAPSRFEAIADEVAQRIAAHFEGLQPRTLVMIFGDHGFCVQAQTDGHAARSLTEGGASPEEVMVPAFAWLVGAVH